MTNRNVFEIIDRLVAPTTNGTVFTPSEVFTAIVHGYYYIRPGKDTYKFLEKIDSILEEGWKYRRKMYKSLKNGVPYESWLWSKMAYKVLSVMRSMFNKRTYDYFKDKMKDDMEFMYDDEMLERFLYCLEVKDLKNVFDGLLAFKESNNFFISDESYEDMMKEFLEYSLYVSEQESEDDDEYAEHAAFINSTPGFFFYYLCRETIIDIICKHIDIDPFLLAHMIKAYVYTEESKTAAEYTGLAAKLMYGYDMDVFEPIITDASKMTPEIFKANDSNVTFRDGSFEFTIGSFVA